MKHCIPHRAILLNGMNRKWNNSVILHIQRLLFSRGQSTPERWFLWFQSILILEAASKLGVASFISLQNDMQFCFPAPFSACGASLLWCSRLLRIECRHLSVVMMDIEMIQSIQKLCRQPDNEAQEIFTIDMEPDWKLQLTSLHIAIHTDYSI